MEQVPSCCLQSVDGIGYADDCHCEALFTGTNDYCILNKRPTSTFTFFLGQGEGKSGGITRNFFVGRSVGGEILSPSPFSFFLSFAKKPMQTSGTISEQKLEARSPGES